MFCRVILCIAGFCVSLMHDECTLVFTLGVGLFIRFATWLLVRSQLVPQRLSNRLVTRVSNVQESKEKVMKSMKMYDMN